MTKKLTVICAVVTLFVVITGSVEANWSETFDGNTFDLTTWLFRAYPELTGTFSATIQDGPGDDDYISIDETSPAAVGGSQIGVGLGDPDDIFTDVRVGAVFNPTGNASRNYHGLVARANYFIDDGSISGYPGIVASCYVMTIHYEEGPANLKIELVKAVNLSTDIMETWQPEVPVPGLDHARGHFVELDVVGSDPVYITGSIYEYKGGPLLTRTPTFIDTNANDPWEGQGIHDAVFTSGVSGIFGMYEEPQPAGYHAIFDSVSSVSDGPAAVNPGPVDGAADVSIDADLSWLEAEFANSRDVWFGKKGAMEKIEQSPAGASFDPGTLEFGQTYEWRIDQIGPSGTVTGRTWTFTAVNCMSVEDFEAYTDNAGLMAAWVDNIPDFDYVFLATDAVGNNSMRFELQNQYEPYFTETARTFDSPQDWTVHGVEVLSLSFIGEHENSEHPMYLILEDAAGQSSRVEHPFAYACQSDTWRQWTLALEQFSNAGVDLSSVKKCTIGFGDGTNSGQESDDRDVVFIDEINLCPAGSNDIQ